MRFIAAIAAGWLSIGVVVAVLFGRMASHGPGRPRRPVPERVVLEVIEVIAPPAAA
jgi:hypothetical protein